ncbi:esterase-like activity of phytase family protein [Frigidibacter sp. RF13]|uniref:esterase-like activity of phytase family protein n=1 Tax=Frigidibacter sp. RF13 TaxID=2997340 RepID=UPI002271DED4|nr:esterase-like activity of phytase family protein [Frigidibacter sp. RF13]MCY1127826.1 esterase-like activity of phytase family protein [Frigidibacter sp. RF13]
MYRRSQLGLILALLLASGAAAAPRAVVVGTYDATEAADRFGGLSAIEVTADGAGFIALSDSARLFHGRFRRDGAGAIAGITLDGPGAALTGPDGAALDGEHDDAEGLALAPDGSLYVSFELRNRIARYAADGRLIDRMPVFTVFSTIYNDGLEALAMALDGALYTMPEGPGRGVRSFPVWRYADGTWSEAFRLPEDHHWRPVGADFGPDGRLYILERDLWGLVGFRSRLRRITLAEGQPTQDEILMESRAGAFGNLEGLSVWQDAAGSLRATMVADNNFLPVMSTEFVEVRIEE